MHPGGTIVQIVLPFPDFSFHVEKINLGRKMRKSPEKRNEVKRGEAKQNLIIFQQKFPISIYFSFSLIFLGSTFYFHVSNSVISYSIVGYLLLI